MSADWWGRTALYIAIDRKDGGGSGGGMRRCRDATRSHSARTFRHGHHQRLCWPRMSISMPS